MKRITFLGATLLALPASAQTTSTQCRWIGNIWSCDSKTDQPTTAPIDQGAILRRGSAVVPPYQPQTVPRTVPQPDTSYRPGSYLNAAGGIQAPDVRLFMEAVQQCQADHGKPLKDAWLGRSESNRRDYQMMCLAYTMGRTDERRDPKP